MSQIKTLNGVQYTLPQFSDIGWGANTGNVLTQYIAAIADVTLQLSGGSFTLTADTNFGANFGLVSAYFTSRTASAATAGAVRLAKTDVINWRNNAGDGNISLSKNTSNELLWNSSRIILAGGGLIVNADISASAAIAYSKLALTGSIVNADIGASAAIAYSKLALTGSVVNADIGASAAIAYSKLALTGALLNADINASAGIVYSKLSLTGSILNADINASAAIALTKLAALSSHSRALVSDSSGFITEATTTSTEIGYVNGVTSAIQTQITAKAADSAVVHNTGTENVAGAKTFTTQLIGKGTATNDSAAAGYIGEQIASVVTNVSAASSNTYGDMTSIALTAGDWDVTLMVAILPNGATFSGNTEVGISSTSGNSFPDASTADNQVITVTPASFGQWPMAVVAYRVSIASPATYYAKMKTVFSVATPKFYGRLSARRVR